jgi:Glutamine amidotransferase class-I
LPRSEHPFYFGTQFHPEFKSRPNRPSPPFYALVAAARAHQASGAASATGTKAKAKAQGSSGGGGGSSSSGGVSRPALGVAGAMWRQHEAQLMLTAAQNAVALSPLGKRERSLSSSSASKEGAGIVAASEAYSSAVKSPRGSGGAVPGSAGKNPRAPSI